MTSNADLYAESIIQEENMHLIELINTQKLISMDIQTYGLNYNKHRIIDLGAVIIEGWLKHQDRIKTGVLLTKKFSFCVDYPNNIVNDEISNVGVKNSELSNSQDIKIALQKLKEFVGGNIISGYNIEQTCSILNSVGLPFGIKFKNKVLDTLAIAKSIYKDKINSYGLLDLAKRHGISCKTFCALDNACIMAHLLGELALRDDEAHCDY